MKLKSQGARQFLRELFEFEFCAECGGDAQHHSAVPFIGWFARCKFPPCESTGDLHPTVAAFRAEYDKESDK